MFHWYTNNSFAESFVVSNIILLIGSSFLYYFLSRDGRPSREGDLPKEEKPDLKDRGREDGCLIFFHLLEKKILHKK